MNKCILIGNVTRDVDIQTTGNGISLCRFDIAVSRPFAGADGKRETDFIKIVAWRGLADSCGKYLRKGSKVAVCGAMQNRDYEAQDGTKRYITEIVADNVEFLSSQSSSQNTDSNGGNKGNVRQSELEPINADDLPF